VTELAQETALARFGADAIRQGVLRLLQGEQVVPLRGKPGRPAAAYNRVILDQRLSAQNPVVLASPAAGTGIVVPALQAVALRVLTGVAPDDRDGWLRAFVSRQPVSLHVSGRPVDDPDEQARVLALEVEKFRSARLPKLVALGVVEP
jgi:hypothetical protein